eukprot:scpid92081/ scgid32224/ 
MATQKDFPPATTGVKMTLGETSREYKVQEAFPEDMPHGLDMFGSTPPCKGPWHTVVRVVPTFRAANLDATKPDEEQEWSGPPGSGFITDLLAPTGTSGQMPGTEPQLSVILTAAHVLLDKKAGMAHRVNIYTVAADGKSKMFEVESNTESRRNMQCTFAVSAHCMQSPTSRPPSKFDYAAIYIDLGACFFPDALHVDMSISADQLTKLHSDKAMMVAGYRGRSDDGADLYMAKGKACHLRGVITPQLLNTTTAQPEAELLYHTADTDKGQSGSPLYFKKGKFQWQAIAIHSGESESVVCEKQDHKKVLEETHSTWLENVEYLKGNCNIGVALTSDIVKD